MVHSAEVEEDKAWLQEAFEEFWARQALQVVLIYYQNGIKVFTYNPFTKEYVIEVSDGGELPKLYTHGITDMHGYPIKMYFFDTVIKQAVVEEVVNGKIKYNGVAGKYFEMLKDIYNGSLEIHRLSQDFDEATITNADTNMPLSDFISMFRELYDFDMIMAPMRMYSDNELDKVFLYERSDFIIVIPSGELIPRYLYIFLIVPKTVWIAVLTSLFVLTFMTGIIKIIAGFKPQFLNVLNDNFRLLLNTSITVKKRKMQEKLLLVLWMFHCLIFVTLFQSNLTTSLIVPKYYPDIDSLQELYKTNIKVSLERILFEP